MRRLPHLTLIALLFLTVSCNKLDQYWKHNPNGPGNENAESFQEIGTIDIGDAGAAEISAFDPKTDRLFVVNNGTVNKIDVLDMSNPNSMSVIYSIDLANYGGLVNSLDVHNGILAAAIEANDKTSNGVVALFNTEDYSEVKLVPVGALPDMIIYSPDGKFILTANEGEPSTDYVTDPVGTVSIISVDNNYQAVNVDFSSFASQADALKAKGLRVYGPGASFAQDMEPEYITVSGDSKTAWVTLQENNAIAKIDLDTKTATAIFPLGFKDYNITGSAIDPSDKDNQVGAFRKVPVYGIYEPDGIAILEKNGTPFLFTANEGDAREYDAFAEVKRIKDITLDENAFKNAADLQKDEQIGRLNITTTLGKNSDDKFEALFSLGGRGFSVWNGNDGKQVFDSKNNLEEKVVAAGLYDDGRSDDKGVEPEGMAIGFINSKPYAFVGMERADAVAIYDISNPHAPTFVKVLPTGDGPEGVLFISKNDSPVDRSLLVVSSENDGVIKVYAPVN